MPKVSDSVYINSKPETKTLKEESGNILYIIQKLIYIMLPNAVIMRILS